MTPRTVKEILLGFLSIGAIIGSFLLWRGATQAIAEEVFTSYGQFIVSIGSLVIAVAVFGIAATFVQNPWIMYISAAVSVILPFLLIPLAPIAGGTAGICALLTLLAVRRIRKEFNLSLGFSVATIFKAGIPLFLTVCGIIISFFYLNDVQKKDAVRAIFPRTAFNVTIRALGGPLRSLTGSQAFTPDETVDQFFQELIKKQLGSRGIALDQIQSKELQRLLVQQRNEIAKSYGIKLNGNEKLGDVFYTTIIERISDLLGPYRIYLPYASALTFFLAFKTLSLFLYLIVVGAAFLFIELMTVMHLLAREKKQIEVERLTLN